MPSKFNSQLYERKSKAAAEVEKGREHTKGNHLSKLLVYTEVLDGDKSKGGSFERKR